VGDSVQFLQETFTDLMRAIAGYERAAQAALLSKSRTGASLLRHAQAQTEEVDLAYLGEAVPKAFARTTDGVSRVAEIVSRGEGIRAPRLP